MYKIHLSSKGSSLSRDGHLDFCLWMCLFGLLVCNSANNQWSMLICWSDTYHFLIDMENHER